MNGSKALFNGRRTSICIFSLLNLLLLLFFADRNGYEGDDLNSILPALHLSEALKGNLDIYRYDWQPLSYAISSAIYRLTGTPLAIFLLAPLAASISLALILAICLRQLDPRSGLFIPIMALLAFPEFWFSGLYYNSTILGLPFALGSFLLLINKSQSSVDRLAAASAAAVLIGIAIFIRIDFVLALPALAVAAWCVDRSVEKPILFILGVLAVVALAFLTGLLGLDRIMESYRSASSEISSRSAEPGWDLRTKLLVISVVLSPVGWIILLLSGPIVLHQSIRRAPLASLAVLFAMIPLVAPLRHLLSVKYALPLFMFLPIFMTHCLLTIEQMLRPSSRFIAKLMLATSTVLQLFLSASFYGKPPYLEISTLASRPIGTHDGTRSYGGYLWQMASVDRWATPSKQEIDARSILNDILHFSGPDFVIVGEEGYFTPGAVGWRHLQLLLEQSGFRGVLVAPHMLQFNIGSRRLWLLRHLNGKDDLALFERGRGVALYDFRDLGVLEK